METQWSGIQILLVEDDEDDYTLIRDLLSAPFAAENTLHWVSDYDAALEALCGGDFDACLLDYRLGPRNGLEFLKEAILHGDRTPIIFLTGQGDYGLDLEVMKSGAADYLTKDQLNPAQLERSIRYTLERKQKSDELIKAQRTIRTLSECNDALLRTKDEVELLREICRIAVEVGGYRMAWVGWAEDDLDLTVRPVAHCGYEEGYLDAIRISWKDCEWGRGPTGTAIRTGTPRVIRFLQDEPEHAPWRTEATRRGYASAISLPFFLHGRASGALSIYASESDAFAAEEVETLRKLSANLSYGIEALRVSLAHKQAEQSLRMAYEDLEKRVLERTAELVEVNDRLRREVNDRRLAEGALRASETKLRTLFEAVSAPVFFKDTEGRYLGCNRAFEEFFGASRESLIGKTVYEIADNEIADEYHRKDRELLDGCHSQTYESKVITAGGEIREVIFSKSRFNDSQGNVAGLIGVVLDITERKRAEDALRAALDLNQTMQSATIEEVIDSGLERGVQLTGSRIGFFFLVHPDQQTFTPQQWSRGTLDQCATDAQGVHFPVEKAGMWADAIRQRSTVVHNDYASMPHKTGLPPGHVPLVREMVVPVLERDEVVAVMGVGNKEGNYSGFDVSQLTLIAETLWNIIRIKWFEADLEEAKVAAEAATKAKSEFLANMSHEIRTPISVVMGLTDMALCLEASPEMLDILANIKGTSASLLQIINDILDFSKIEAGRLDLMEDTFGLPDLVDSLMTSLRAEAEKKRLDLSCSISPAVPSFFIGDVTRLRQALMNLLGNALKFTERGKVSMRVERIGRPPVEEEVSGDSENVELRFSVSDTGMGISAEVQPELFKSFVQGDLSTSKKYGGTGLGLAITRRLVELMGGRIWVKSSEGRGATFYFTVRLRDATQQQRDLSNSEARDQMPLPTSRRLKILLAEDNPLNRKFLVHFLRRAGHEVNTASNGLEAVHELTQCRYDLALMDIQMPEMDGLEATRVIRNREAPVLNPHIPIIALTAYAMKEDQERFTSAGMDGHVTKPVDMDALLQAIDSVMGKKSENSRDVLQVVSGPLVEEAMLRLNFGTHEELRAFIMEAIGNFLVDAPWEVQKIQEAAMAGKHDQVAANAHRLVNIAGNVRASEVLRIARKMEQSARADDREGILSALDALNAILKPTLDVLTGFRFSKTQ